MYLLIFILPLVNIINCIRTIGNKSKNFSVIGAFFTLLIGLLIIAEKNDLIIQLGNWVDLLNLQINWTLRFDILTKSMLFPILLISFLVQVFSLSYMGEDPHVSRFYLYLNLFTFAMLLLVTGDNWFTLFLGWEGVGLVSYLLVNFWFTRIDANHASLKAFLMNRIGDWGLTLGILFWYIAFGDISVNLYLSNLHPDLIFIIGLFLFLGAIAKSAQIGLHSWLTSAMEGKFKAKNFIIRNYLTNRNTDVEPTNYQKQVILGLILSNASIPISSNRLTLTFKKDHLEFTTWLKFSILGSLSSLTPPTPLVNPTQYWIGTRTNTYFKKLREQWYNTQKVKIIPKN